MLELRSTASFNTKIANCSIQLFIQFPVTLGRIHITLGGK